MSSPSPHVYSISEFARLLGVSISLVRKEIAEGNIRVNKFGKRVLIPRAELERFTQVAEASE